MPLRPFILLTFSGSFIWVVLLSVLGYVLGANQDILMKYYHEMLIILSIVGVAWLSFSIFKKKKKKKIMI